MKYLKLFPQESDYQVFITGGGVELPNVSYCENENEVHYNPLIQLNNEIWYTSSNGKIVEPSSDSTAPFLDANGNNIPIVSNTYENGKGVIKLEKDCYKLGHNAFYKSSNLLTITIPNSVTIIADAFDSCSGLTTVNLGNGVTTIDNYAFRSCTSLTEITIPESVTTIGKQAFYNCKSLIGITIPDKVTLIGENAFNGCSSLTRIAIPDSVTTIGASAFAGWTGATSTNNIVFPNEQLKIKYFESNSAFEGWKSLISVTVPETVTTIGNQAFYNCSNLSEITIPNSVTSFKSFAFNGCSSLTRITIPDSVTTIGGYAFGDCTSLTSITIPDSVTSIEMNAFVRCTSLTSITVKSVTPPRLGVSAFYGIASNAVIYVPSGSVDAYKTAYRWSNYADIIDPIQE